jgi:hypothetical protein
MKRLIKIFLSAFLAATLYPVSAQNNAQTDAEKRSDYNMGKHRLAYDFTYDHNITDRSNFFSDLTYLGSPLKWLDITAGAHISTVNNYAALARTDFKYRVCRQGEIVLRNQYQYNVYVSDNMQSFNIVLMAAFDHDYFYAGIGTLSQFFFMLKQDKTHNNSLIEPIDIAYDLQGRIFPKHHNWNIGLQITNIRPFSSESYFSPNFIISGYLDVLRSDSGRMRANMKCGLQPTGILSIAAHYYEFYITAGIECTI